MLNFTKGKWTYDSHCGCVHREGALIANVAGAGGANYRHDRGQANARLIAATPDLLAIVQALADCQPHQFSTLKLRAGEFLEQLEDNGNE